MRPLVLKFPFPASRKPQQPGTKKPARAGFAIEWAIHAAKELKPEISWGPNNGEKQPI